MGMCRLLKSDKVSIPYEREGTWKVITKFSGEVVDQYGFNSLRTGRDMERRLPRSRLQITQVQWFQFPTNGKGHGKPKRPQPPPLLFLVSIPYEREGTWKGMAKGSVRMTATTVFQFPTNGKGHGKETKH